MSYCWRMGYTGPRAAKREARVLGHSTTGPTILLPKPLLDIGAARVVDSLCPAPSRLALWTAHLLACPVDREVLDGIASPNVRLPAAVRTGRAPQRHAVLLPAGDEQRRVDVRRIDQVLVRGQALGDEGLLDGLRALRLMDGRRRRVHVREH
jgi:hypothetical protein